MNEEQLGLFDRDVFKGYDLRTRNAFWKYHEQRPQIFEKFKQYAYQMKRAGREHYGAKGIIERIRWDMHMGYEEGDFKISNTFFPLYARLLVKECPEFDGFFRLKKVRGIKNPYFKKEKE